jgi:hypothetical protein
MILTLEEGLEENISVIESAKTEVQEKQLTPEMNGESY